MYLYSKSNHNSFNSELFLNHDDQIEVFQQLPEEQKLPPEAWANVVEQLRADADKKDGFCTGILDGTTCVRTAVKHDEL